MRRLVRALLLLSLPSLALAAEQSGRDLLVPIVGRTPGAFGSMWQSDLVVTNNTPNYASLEIQLEFNDGEATTANVSIAARETVVLEDVLRTTFGRESAMGSLRIRAAASDARIIARASIYNVAAGQEGRFGQHVPGVPVDQLAELTLLNLGAPAAGTRTNFGVSNPSDEPAVVNILVGFRTHQTIQIPPRGVVQINDIYQGHPVDLSPLYLRANHPVYTYASIIDSSGDPLFIAGAPAEAAEPLPPACAQPLVLHRNPKDEFLAPGYNVILQSPSVIDATLAKYGIQPRHVLRATGGFTAEMTPETVAALRCDPAVVVIEHDQYGGAIAVR